MENLPRCGAGGQSLSVGREISNRSVPILRQLAAHHLLELASLIRKFLRIGGKSPVPFRLGLFSFANGLAKTGQSLLWQKEWRLRWPAQFLFRPLHFLTTQRRAVRFESVLLAG